MSEFKFAVRIVYSEKTMYEWQMQTEEEADKLLEDLYRDETVMLRYIDNNKPAAVIKTRRMAYACKVPVNR
jgi:hypothetical protein